MKLFNKYRKRRAKEFQASNKQFKNKTKFIKRVVELDKSQPEFKLTLDQYLKRVVTPTRIKKANQKYNENKITYSNIKALRCSTPIYSNYGGIETDLEG